MPSQEHNIDARCRKVAGQFRKLIFKEFGEPSKMTEADMDACMRTIVTIHVGELVDFAARFSTGMTVREGCIHLIDAMIAANPDEIAKITGTASRLDYLRNTEAK